MNHADLKLLRLSLVVVWLITAAVSLIELNGQGMALLAKAGVTDRATAVPIILAGAGVDLLLGLAMALRPSRRVYQLALLMMLAMTAVATVLDPSLWLHPLGPLLKNLPMAAALWLLIRASK